MKAVGSSVEGWHLPTASAALSLVLLLVLGLVW